MERKAVSGIMLTILLIGMLTLAFNTQQVMASEPPTTQWSQTYGGAGDDVAQSVVQTSDGGYAVAGYTYSYGAGSWDFWLVKTDSSGNMLWSQTYGGAGSDGVYSMVQTGDGGYALTGVTYSYGAGGSDFWLVKTDAAGTVQWSQTYGGAGTEWGSSVVQTGDGGYALAGVTYSYGAGGYDFWLVKVGPELLPPPILESVLDIDPDTLNLRSKGEWITAYIELPEGYDVNNIDVSSMMLNSTIPVDLDAPTQIGDYDNDAVPDLMVKFNRAELILYIYDAQKIKYGNVTLTMTSKLKDGTPFGADDIIMVMLRGDVNNDRIIDILDLALIARALGTDVSYPKGTGWDQWNPNADLNLDNNVDVNDLCISGSSYGATIP